MDFFLLTVGHGSTLKMTLFHLLLSIYLGTISLAVEVVSVTPPRELYWNRTNNLFASSHNVLEVQVKERVQFNCPYYPDGGGNFEHYIIYMVKKEHYDGCYLPSLPSQGVRQVHNCSTPHNHSSTVILIDPYPALPVQFGGYEFKPGETYYFTSISTGSPAGLNNRDTENSSCRKWNMKAALQVCCNQTGDSSTPDPSWVIHSTTPTTTRRTTPKTTTPTLTRIITSTVKQTKTDPQIGTETNSSSDLHKSVSILLTVFSIFTAFLTR